ncbi:MAG TPA: CHRD domain-containing protein [Noviherbaspirillum sp.]|nr:CHRD domain-containing protein [Noviherbaspirillum sp.]
MRSARLLGAMAVLLGVSGNFVHATGTNGTGATGTSDTPGVSGANTLSATLSGFNEVPLTILSPGNGNAQLNIDRAGGSISYTLTYADVTSPVTQAHIHFGKVHTAGGIVAFLCSNASSPPAGTPACPESGGTVTGTITSGQVVAQETQNVPANDFRALVQAIDSGTAYVNVHTTRFPAGELRGQLSPGDDNGSGSGIQNGR